jgi:hypothetical protein
MAWICFQSPATAAARKRAASMPAAHAGLATSRRATHNGHDLRGPLTLCNMPGLQRIERAFECSRRLFDAQ